MVGGPSLAKPKRKLQRVDPHTRQLPAKLAAGPAQATSAAQSEPWAQGKAARASSANPVGLKSRSGKAALPVERHTSDDEEAVLAGEPVRADTPAGVRAGAGSSPWSGGQRGEKTLVALGGMHTHEQQAYSSKLAKIGVQCVTHKQCPRCNLLACACTGPQFG